MGTCWQKVLGMDINLLYPPIIIVIVIGDMNPWENRSNRVDLIHRIPEQFLSKDMFFSFYTRLFAEKGLGKDQELHA